MPRSTTSIIKEQATIEAIADRQKQQAKDWVASQKSFMRSISDLPYGEWRRQMLARAKDTLAKEATFMLEVILGATWEISKADTSVKSLSKKDTLKVASTQKTTGKTPEENINILHAQALGTLASESTRLAAQGLAADAIITAIMGSAPQLYKNGSLIQYINGRRTHSTTNLKSAVEAVRQKEYNESGAIGYIWNSVLDGRTSTTCQGLNNKRFYFKKKVDGNWVNTTGYAPLPPIHFSCRSTTLPIYDRNNVPKVETFDEWTSTAEGKAELLEALGPGKYALWESGELPIRRFTDARFKPLSIDALNNQLAPATSAQKGVRAAIQAIRADGTLTTKEQVALINALTN